MAFFDLQNIILKIAGNFITIIYDSLTTFLIAFLIIFIFKIKDSNVKILFFFLPLIKPVIIISEKLQYNTDYFLNKNIVIGFRVPTPSLFIKRLEPIMKNPFNFNYLNNNIIYIISFLILLILIIRWISIYFFYKKISQKKYEDIYYDINILTEKHSKILKIKKPSINLIKKDFISPFTIGIKDPTVVISKKTIQILNDTEKEILIQHELSHIKRKDNIISWLALILKDIFFFNPISYIAYNLIRLEQEKASDKLVVQNSEIKNDIIAQNILSIIIKLIEAKQNKLLYLNQNPSFFSFSNKITSFYNFKMLEIRIKSILSLNKNKIYMILPLRIFMYFLFLLILFIQIIIIIKINGNFIFLR